MKKIDVAEFKARIVELVGEVMATGETFVICENDKPFARGYERVEQLVREGKLKHGFRPLPDDFFTQELVEMPGAVDELLRERYCEDDEF